MKGKASIGWTQGGWERRLNKKGKKDFTPVSKEGGSLKQEPRRFQVSPYSSTSPVSNKSSSLSK
jgi:hypothetical protein